MNELFRGHGPWIIPNEWLSFSSKKITSSWLVDLPNECGFRLQVTSTFTRRQTRKSSMKRTAGRPRKSWTLWNFNVLIIEKTKALRHGTWVHLSNYLPCLISWVLLIDAKYFINHCICLLSLFENNCFIPYNKLQRDTKFQQNFPTCHISNLRTLNVAFFASRQISQLHLYDCLRANKAMMAWGVEVGEFSHLRASNGK